MAMLFSYAASSNEIFNVANERFKVANCLALGQYCDHTGNCLCFARVFAQVFAQDVALRVVGKML